MPGSCRQRSRAGGSDVADTDRERVRGIPTTAGLPPTATSDGDAQTRTILRVTRTSPLQLSTASDGSLTAKGFPGSRSVGPRHGPAGCPAIRDPTRWDDTAFPHHGRRFAAPDQAPPTLVKHGRLRPPACPMPDPSPSPCWGPSPTQHPSVGIPPALGPWVTSHGAVGERVGYTQPPPMMLTTLDALPASPTASSEQGCPRRPSPQRHPHPSRTTQSPRYASKSPASPGERPRPGTGPVHRRSLSPPQPDSMSTSPWAPPPDNNTSASQPAPTAGPR